MANKKKDDPIDVPELSDEPEEVQPVVLEDNGADNKHFVKGEWAGHPHYQCAHCEYDTLFIDLMSEHLFWVHSILEEEK
jgi:hypothetical protein